jgi:hypothetical protein
LEDSRQSLAISFFFFSSPMSEIDHIFASNPKGISSPASPSANKQKKQKKKKEKKKKKNTTKPEIPPRDIIPPTSSKKHPLPETIVDTSHKFSGPSKRHKGHQSHVNDANPKSGSGPVVNPSFKDSRGASSRRKTEEGWLVYKEDELGIGDEGGDTPLCPFDCECCF